MKGIILATICSACIFLAMTVAYRAWPGSDRVRTAFWIYVASLPIYGVAYALTPAGICGLLIAGLSDPVWLDALVGFFCLSASFFGGWLQLYNLTNRGYSLRMLVDLLAVPKQSSTPDEMVTAYADGRGLEWMYDIRLAGIFETQLATEQSGMISLTPKGARAARVAGLLRWLYRIEDSRA